MNKILKHLIRTPQMETTTLLLINILGQACCWWHCFNCCGCIEVEREVIRTERQPTAINVTRNNNPFVNPNVPRDAHLQSAYV